MSENVRAHRHGSEVRRRQPRIIIRVTPDERAEIKANAAGAGLSVGSYLRALAIAHPRTRPCRRPLGDAVLLTRVMGQVGRIGGNIHQLVRLANRGEIPESDELKAAGREVCAFMADAVKALRG
jgi:mobilization protein NikA